MKKKDSDLFEKRLLEERAKLVKELQHLDDTVLNKSLKDSSGDLSGYSFHMADMGSDAFERERAFLAASSEGRALLEVDEALRRLYRGEYGVCDGCGSDIPPRRLEAMPQATLCLTCKEKRRRRGAVRDSRRPRRGAAGRTVPAPEPAGPRLSSIFAPEPAASPASASRLLVFVAIAVVVVALDHLTKWLVVRHLPFNHDVQIIGDWVMLTHIKNTGGAFGLFPGSTLPLIVVSSLASVIIVILALRLRRDWPRLVALGLILGGAIGNLIDRIVQGKVTDFIHVGIPDGPRWPIFNVADSAVSVGVVMLAWFVYVHGSHHDEAAAAAPGPPAAPLPNPAGPAEGPAGTTPDHASPGGAG